MGLLVLLLTIMSIPLGLMVIHMIDLIKSIQEKEKQEELLNNTTNETHQFIYKRNVCMCEDNVKNNITYVIGYVIAFIVFTLFTIWFIKSCNAPYHYPDSMRDERIKIEYKLSYYDKLFYDYLDEAKEYNREVNRSNTKFIRFKVEDRTEYMIDIDYYMTEFNNRTTTTD